MNFRNLTFIPVSLLLAACGNAAEDSTPSVDEWLGESTHLAITGSYQGTALNIRLEGDAAAGVHCESLYAPLPGTVPDAEGNYDTSQLYFVFKEVGALIDWGGQPKEFTISYWRHDVPADTTLEVVPRVFGSAIPEGQTWSDINVFDPGTDLLSGIESAASSGTVEMKMATGVPDDNGVYIASARTGEFLSVSWGPEDNLNVSATADCTSGVQVWPQTRLLP